MMTYIKAGLNHLRQVEGCELPCEGEQVLYWANVDISDIFPISDIINPNDFTELWGGDYYTPELIQPSNCITLI